MPELTNPAVAFETVPINDTRHLCSPAWLRLARHEQQLLHIPDVPVAATLWISADADWSAQQAASPLLTRLYPSGDRLHGNVTCANGALPFESDSMQTIVVQHAADLMPSDLLGTELLEEDPSPPLLEEWLVGTLGEEEKRGTTAYSHSRSQLSDTRCLRRQR